MSDNPIDNPIDHVSDPGQPLAKLPHPLHRHPLNPTTQIYLSGPMTGYPENNYPAFMFAEKALRYVLDALPTSAPSVYNPARWTQYRKREAFNIVDAFTDYTHYITNTATMVVVLHGWVRSPGARTEAMLAAAIGKPVYSFDELINRENDPKPLDVLAEIIDAHTGGYRHG